MNSSRIDGGTRITGAPVSCGVPLLDLTRMEDDLRAELRQAFDRVLASGNFILGPEVRALEQSIAAYLGVKHAIGVSSGTDALLMALMAIGVGPGDEVICPAYTFFATAGCIWRLGARPVFTDCSLDTYNVEATHVERALTPRTKAVIPVHLFGQCADMGPILDLCRPRGVAVIEDAAQALGAEYRGRRAGGLGAVGCFSFFPTKNLGAFGDAGLVVTEDDGLAEILRVLRGHGGKPKYYHLRVGGNFRLDALQAAILRVKLPRLDAWIEARQRNAKLYRQLFTDAGAAELGLSLPVESVGVRHIYNQFVVRLGGPGRRDALKEHLARRQICTEVYYPRPMHLQPCFASLREETGPLPHAEAAAQETVSLPVFPELRIDEVRAVVAAVMEFLGR